MVPAPGIIGGMHIEADLGKVGTGAGQVFQRKLLHGFIPNVNAYLLRKTEVLHELRIGSVDGPDLSWPGGLLVGPAQPGGPVRGEFCREIIAKGCRCAHAFWIRPARY
jgi:hypothetical protein